MVFDLESLGESLDSRYEMTGKHRSIICKPFPCEEVYVIEELTK